MTAVKVLVLGANGQLGSDILRLWNDPAVVIDWPTDAPQLSGRDQQAMSLQQYIERPAFEYGKC